MIIIFDLNNINNPPNLKFLRAERLLDEYRGNLVENLAKWDCNNDVINEVLKLLGFGLLPKKP